MVAASALHSSRTGLRPTNFKPLGHVEFHRLRNCAPEMRRQSRRDATLGKPQQALCQSPKSLRLLLAAQKVEASLIRICGS
jgi:hypothetical protein